jgi:hypothetical protein
MPRIPYGQRASRMGAICEHCIGTKTDLEIDRDLARQARWWDADDGNMVRVPEHAFDRRVHTVSSPTDPSIVCTVDVFDPYSRAALKDPACDAAADRVFQQLMDANVVAEIPDENAPNGRAVYTAMDCAACGLPFEVRDEFALVFVIRSRDRRWTGAICTDCVREPEKVDGSLMRQALAWLEGR